MTRYFYTDPLAAAWMVRHFGFRLGNRETTIWYTENDIITRAFHPAIDSLPLYVHLDCEHLLQPQVHDVVSYLFTSEPDYFSSTAKRTTQNYKSVTKGKLFSLRARNITELRIIQRNGKPFFWPERD